MLTLAAAALAASAFAYSTPLKVHYGSAVVRQGVAQVSFSYTGATGSGNGLIVRGAGSGPHPAVLFVHWLGDAKTTNHTEFTSDQIELARHGITSLSIDAMWAHKDWFDKGRDTSTDYQRSIDQVVDLRRALDVLQAQPNVDSSRIAYVGHDFGSMYGAVLAGVDPRPRWYVLMAGTQTFSEWYLLGKKPANVQAYVTQMAPLDPTHYLARSHAVAYYFQFSAHDAYITPAKELAFFSSAPLPRGMALYDVDHSLALPVVHADRIAWLLEKLRP